MTIENVFDDICVVCKMKNLSLQAYFSNDGASKAFIIYKMAISNEIYVTKNNSEIIPRGWQLWITKKQKDNFKYSPTNLAGATLYCSYDGMNDGVEPLKEDILKLINDHFLQPKRLTIFNFVEEE